MGLCIAYQLVERGISYCITVLEKERELSRHRSGTNSGELHADLYYKPASLKAQICESSSRRLRA